MGCSLVENCGVIGILSLEGLDVTPLLISGLEALQHRGQEAWGIAVWGHRTFKRPGVVAQSIEAEYDAIRRMRGSAGIGHVRYSTTARSTVEHAQPIDLGGPGDERGFRIAHNGTLDRDLLAEALEGARPPSPRGVSDTELLGMCLYRMLREGRGWAEAFERLSPALNGSFSLVVLTSRGELVGV
ncbi:MAG: hypothetical protein QXT74_04830, partial [Candidatus Nezhaarchaeales archaeon]